MRVGLRWRSWQNCWRIHMMFNKELKRIVVEGCDENDKDALRWCVAKPDKRKSRKMMGRPFSELIYREMGWEEGCRYKILGYRIQFEGKTLYVFDLNVPEVFLEKKRKKKTDDDIETSEPVTAQVEEQPEVNTRKGLLSGRYCKYIWRIGRAASGGNRLPPYGRLCFRGGADRIGWQAERKAKAGFPCHVGCR